MKIALYIENGLEQIVLTPQSETEKLLLRNLGSGDRTLNVYKGGFYHCQGGWTRHSSDFDSIILVSQNADTGD